MGPSPEKDTLAGRPARSISEKLFLIRGRIISTILLLATSGNLIARNGGNYPSISRICNTSDFFIMLLHLAGCLELDASDCEKYMFKILLIDRCNFSRAGLEIWLDSVNCFSSPLLVSGINSLLLAKKHIVHWQQPNLVIVDLHGFTHEPHQMQLISSLMSACENQSQVILLQSSEDQQFGQYCQHQPVRATLCKRIRLDELTRIIDTALRSRPEPVSTQAVTTLLTRQEEKVLSLWMEGQSNNMIAKTLNIRGKTVYTYKRNIRMKLHMDNRFSPFTLSGKAE